MPNPSPREDQPRYHKIDIQARSTLGREIEPSIIPLLDSGPDLSKKNLTGSRLLWISRTVDQACAVPN